jgi:hypothetical protein
MRRMEPIKKGEDAESSDDDSMLFGDESARLPAEASKGARRADPTLDDNGAYSDSNMEGSLLDKDDIATEAKTPRCATTDLSLDDSDVLVLLDVTTEGSLSSVEKSSDAMNVSVLSGPEMELDASKGDLLTGSSSNIKPSLQYSNASIDALDQVAQNEPLNSSLLLTSPATVKKPILDATGILLVDRLPHHSPTRVSGILKKSKFTATKTINRPLPPLDSGPGALSIMFTPPSKTKDKSLLSAKKSDRMRESLQDSFTIDLDDSWASVSKSGLDNSIGSIPETESAMKNKLEPQSSFGSIGSIDFSQPQSPRQFNLQEMGSSVGPIDLDDSDLEDGSESPV